MTMTLPTTERVVTGGRRSGLPRAPRAAGTSRRSATGWLFVAPAMVLFGTFTLYPIVQMVYLSMTSSNGFGATKFVGLRNFVTMVNDPIFLQAAGNTIVYTVATTVLLTVFPLALALIIHYGPRRSGALYRTLFFIPAAISLTVTGMLWRLGLNNEMGFVAKIMDAVGLGALVHPWLGDPATVLPVIILVTLWQSCGLFMLIIYAGLGNIDPSIEESARMDGAGKFREAWSITIPMLRPVIGVVVMLNVIHGLKVFDLNWVMAKGGPLHASETFSTYTYLLTFGNASGATSAFGYGSAISLVVFVVTGVVTLIQYRFRKAPL
ncbi:sugar ABC transporter permease [Microbacterium sp. PRC9]|uniref:carbohydrate ABC transporter permease n=1 Tax=Microbacterium sp. PRC9 TaxID=2962591 RepID=UPI002881200D|nr:sugar ABC transporter permease [Microbacterium sp. PRC9]MDT0144553.1 sugar ABC transporter permease [Microbacterium sp. PRC9]